MHCRLGSMTIAAGFPHGKQPEFPMGEIPRGQYSCEKKKVFETFFCCRFDSIFPTKETHSMLIDGVRYDELPIIHIKATHNNTIITVTNGKGGYT